MPDLKPFRDANNGVTRIRTGHQLPDHAAELLLMSLALTAYIGSHPYSFLSRGKRRADGRRLDVLLLPRHDLRGLACAAFRTRRY